MTEELLASCPECGQDVPATVGDRAVPDTEAVREALMWLVTYAVIPREASVDQVTEWRDTVRATLARDVAPASDDDALCDLVSAWGEKFDHDRYTGTTPENARISVTPAEVVDLARLIAARASAARDVPTPADEPGGEMAEHFIDANERMGEAITAIGMALGLGRPGVGNTWGTPEILDRIEEWKTAQDVLAARPAGDVPAGRDLTAQDVGVDDHLHHGLEGRRAMSAGDDTAPRPRTPEAAEAWLRRWIPDSHQEDADAALADLRDDDRGRVIGGIQAVLEAGGRPETDLEGLILAIVDERNRLRAEVAAVKQQRDYLQGQLDRSYYTEYYRNDTLKRRIAVLEGAGNALAEQVLDTRVPPDRQEAHRLSRGIDAWRSAAGSPTTDETTGGA